ncbi:hypothetical protein DW687_11735 [Anaerofustis stercorihominis]|uniref:Uncharacterized protein n=1 Tax=Anaerofustis stercorihominis TaxID=214853 RepID=A0A3E3DUE5_9FIRM|nr:hypothetical protein DW687_11735 [Anaerofustis stercorihominis]
MIRIDENSLICDLAETYHIFNYRSLPARMVATFCVGLRNNSRTFKKITDNKILNTETLLALLLDDFRTFLSLICGEKNKNQSAYELLTSEAKEKSKIGFNSPEEFEKARREILERSKNG